jgi:hypothetical protein
MWPRGRSRRSRQACAFHGPIQARSNDRKKAFCVASPVTRRTLRQKSVSAAIPRLSGGSMALASEDLTHGGDHIPGDQPILIE